MSPRRSAAVSACLVALLGACSESAAVEPQVATESVAVTTGAWTEGSPAAEAGIFGQVVVRSDGCFTLLAGDDQVFEVVWPRGWTARAVQERVEVVREDGTVAFDVPGELEAGGQYGPPRSCGLATAELNDTLR